MEVFIQKDLNLVALTNEMFWEYPLIYNIKTILYSSSLLDYSETKYIYTCAFNSFNVGTDTNFYFLIYSKIIVN